MIDYLRWLFDTEPFLPRSHCGPGWTEELQQSYIAANLNITGAYILIPVALVVTFRKVKAPRRWFLIPAALFVLLCGFGHTIENVLVFWWPAYRFFALWHWLTAIVSHANCVIIPMGLLYWLQSLREAK